jgi:hypothetical protein
MRPAWTLALAALLIASTSSARNLIPVDPADVPTGILYDRVVPLSRAVDYDGANAPAVTQREWLQVYHEMTRASVTAPALPDAAALRSRSIAVSPLQPVPIAVIHARYNRLRPGAMDAGAARIDTGRLQIDRSGLAESEVFAAAAMSAHTYRGAAASFVVDRSWYFHPNTPLPASLAVDPGDGNGYRAAAFGEPIAVNYTTTGDKQVRVRATFPDGRELESTATFRVESLQAPLPDDTIAVTATIPYESGLGSGEAYVYLAPGHGTITQPAVVLEGFDIDNAMNWDELYALLNDENLIEDVRADGYDVIVFNFTDAKDYIQRNAFATVELIETVQSLTAPTTTFALLGASMGGLCARYALSYMETNAIPHRVRTYVSFDTPQNGANIPLGIQYWLDFFSDESAEAAALLASLDSPAARQMLVYHHQDPPTTTGVSDPLRGVLDGELAALGDYPTLTRNVAMSNGSSTMVGQGFQSGEQIIDWNYSSFLVDVVGNVWAVPDGSSAQILQAEIDPIFVSPDVLNVTVSGTSPYDNAPGGWRNSMAQMDSVEAPYGDIVALYDNHCFIPTVSALDLATSDLFYDVAGDPNVLALSPFDAVYFPAENQPHVDITPENKQWILDELQNTPTAVRPASAPQPTLAQNIPNPFNPSTTISFSLPQQARVTLRVYDVGGALVTTLVDGPRPAGETRVTWKGTDAHGRRVGSGVYFIRLDSGGQSVARKAVLLK